MKNILLIIFLLANFISYGQYTGATPYTSQFGANESVYKSGANWRIINVDDDDIKNLIGLFIIIALVLQNLKSIRKIQNMSQKKLHFHNHDLVYMIRKYGKYGNKQTLCFEGNNNLA